MRSHVAIGASMPEHRAETTRIAVAKHEFVEDPVDMIVLGRRQCLLARPYAQRARHAQMNDEPPGIGLEQQILSAPLDPMHRLAREHARQIGRHGPTQHERAHVDPLHTTTRDVRLDAAFGDFYFWKLWHL